MKGRSGTGEGGGSGGESQKVSGGIERNAFVGSGGAESRRSAGLSSLPLLLSSRIPQKPRKSRRKKYGKIENFPIAEETLPQLAQLAPLSEPERFPLHDKLHGSKL